MSNVVAVVTGANKGIGFEIVKQLAKSGVKVVLTARDPGRGLAAQKLLVDQNLQVQFHQLDVTQEKSVSALASWIEEEHKGLDILVNNAAIVGPANLVMETNYFGVKRMTTMLLPLLRPGARVINVSSELGQLKRVRNKLNSEKLLCELEALADVGKLAEERIDSFVMDYVRDSEARSGVEGSYAAYGVSKAALNAYTRVMAIREKGRDVCFNCVHPGYVRTDLNNNKGKLSTEQGADTAVWLAVSPGLAGISGEFFFQRKMFEF